MNVLCFSKLVVFVLTHVANVITVYSEFYL